MTNRLKYALLAGILSGVSAYVLSGAKEYEEPAA